MVYHEKDNYFYQLSYGNIFKVWFLNFGRVGENKSIIEARYKTKKEGMNALKKLKQDMTKPEKFKLPCGHNNAGKINLYPFNEWICLDCGLKTKTIIQENINFSSKKPDYKEGFNLLMEYWESLPDEEKPKIDKKLKQLGI